MFSLISGIVCAPMSGDRLDRLQLPLMCPPSVNTDKHRTAFTVSVDLCAPGMTTGVSARDRQRTCRALASEQSRPEDFGRPGHVFPLREHPEGLRARHGHTEASLGAC